MLVAAGGREQPGVQPRDAFLSSLSPRKQLMRFNACKHPPQPLKARKTTTMKRCGVSQTGPVWQREAVEDQLARLAFDDEKR